MTFWEQVKDVWFLVATAGGVLAAGLGHVVGFRSAQQRNEWRIQQNEKRLEEHEKRLEELRRQSSHYEGTLRVIESTLEQIKVSIDGLRDDLKAKADK